MSLEKENSVQESGQPIKEFIQEVADSFNASFLIGQEVEFPLEDESGNIVWQSFQMKTADELRISREPSES